MSRHRTCLRCTPRGHSCTDGEPHYLGLVPVASLWARAEEIPEAQVVRPLLTIEFDGVQVSDSMQWTGLEDEYIPSGIAGVASVDPSGFQRGSDKREIVILGRAYHEIDDGFGEEPEHLSGVRRSAHGIRGQATLLTLEQILHLTVVVIELCVSRVDGTDCVSPALRVRPLVEIVAGLQIDLSFRFLQLVESHSEVLSPGSGKWSVTFTAPNRGASNLCS